jgi:excisionase family DNA binding protein
MGRLGTSRSQAECSAHLSGMKTTLSPSSGIEPLLNIEDLAAILGVPVTTIYDWRVDGKGPCGIRVGRHVKFAREDIVAWIDAHREARPGRAPDGR